ncbi:MAG: hypothetical protein Q4D17_11225, partial [Planctomycetia bacterium]|nr:hypothetical protein [Planctomycetia bacterium]
MKSLRFIGFPFFQKINESDKNSIFNEWTGILSQYFWKKNGSKKQVIELSLNLDVGKETGYQGKYFGSRQQNVGTLFFTE